jgi:hypothetical protein
MMTNTIMPRAKDLAMMVSSGKEDRRYLRAMEKRSPGLTLGFAQNEIEDLNT